MTYKHISYVVSGHYGDRHKYHNIMLKLFTHEKGFDLTALPSEGFRAAFNTTIVITLSLTGEPIEVHYALICRKDLDSLLKPYASHIVDLRCIDDILTIPLLHYGLALGVNNHVP